MNSYNHYAYGAVADWIYRYAAGIDATPLDAGFHTVVLHPVFDERLGHFAFDYDSPYGPIHSDWTVNGSAATWHVTIPANTTGWWPLSLKAAARYQRNPNVKCGSRDGQIGLELTPGSYTFEVALQEYAADATALYKARTQPIGFEFACGDGGCACSEKTETENECLYRSWRGSGGTLWERHAPRRFRRRLRR